MRGGLAFGLVTLTLALPVSSFADDEGTLAILLPKLATSSERFETMLKKASFTLTGHMETVGGDGAISEKKEGSGRWVNDTAPNFEVFKYVEDGFDKTETAKKDAEEKAKEPKKAKKPDEERHMPFLSSEQTKYDYRIGESDARDPARVRVFFTPKKAAENLFNGSAWVDSRTGDVLSMGIVPSKTPTFVDYLRVTVEFNEKTAQGPAISKIAFEGGGGFLFIKKRFRGVAVLTSYDVR